MKTTTTEQIIDVAAALGWSVETDISYSDLMEFKFRQPPAK